MKVISGIYKGRNIKGFDLEGTRPTMDRVKESLFAMIQEKIKDAIVLDLFTGTGNLAIESLSQGAKYAYVVDKNKKAVKTVCENVDTIGIKDINVINLDYKKALSYYKKNNITFDIIFLDPPYKTNFIEESIKLIDEYSLLKKDGIIIAENEDINKIVYSSKYGVLKSKKYGDKWVVILK